MRGTGHLQATLLALALAGCGGGEGAAPDAAAGGPDAAERAAGALLAERCTDCHGANGVSRTRYIPHLAGQRRGYLDEVLHAYLEGRRDNPAMHAVLARLDPGALDEVAAYFAAQRVLPGPTLDDPRADPEVSLEATRWVSRCDRCHGELRWGDPERFPILDGQRPEYLASAMHAYQNQFLRRSSAMHAMTDPLGARDIGVLAAYYASRAGSQRVGGMVIE